jgi:hypothetical protein
LDDEGSPQVTHEVRWLAHGPFEVVRRYNGYAINGSTQRRESDI